MQLVISRLLPFTAAKNHSWPLLSNFGHGYFLSPDPCVLYRSLDCCNYLTLINI